ncbi:MAG: hypothetical protein COB46_06720 [Rhodospirillaceae bacterium]|nr:MAG: hypothetical protein COB46_06720 [Rhodospirillaceae bacterium]
MKHLIFLSLLVCLGVTTTSAQAGSPSLRLYGNWCGPGNAMNSAAPIDPLDNACRQHDVCYAQNGFGKCGCDIGFMRQLRALPYPTPQIQSHARAMYDALAVTPCDNPLGWAEKQSLMWTDIATDTLNGRGSPLDVPLRWMKMLSLSTPTTNP